jgi:hypothetical protein
MPIHTLPDITFAFKAAVNHVAANSTVGSEKSVY